MIDSIEALKRIPVGTRLFLIRTLAGSCEPIARTIVNIDERDMVLRTDDGRVSYLSFMPGMKIEPTLGGFLVRESLVMGTLGNVVAQYIVAAQVLKAAS